MRLLIPLRNVGIPASHRRRLPFSMFSHAKPHPQGWGCCRFREGASIAPLSTLPPPPLRDWSVKLYSARRLFTFHGGLYGDAQTAGLDKKRHCRA
jgi:hypothetical protein